jgi:hypothetical protein
MVLATMMMVAPSQWRHPDVRPFISVSSKELRLQAKFYAAAQYQLLINV